MRMFVTGCLCVLFLSTPPAFASGGGASCPWDCGDGDGEVGIVDFLALLADWGQAGPCDFDGGSVGITDFLQLLANWGPCPVCGPGAGSCFQSHAGIGCDDIACCTAICVADPFCCQSEWDILCVDQALTGCGDCGDPQAGNCFVSNGTPGCTDPDCCGVVCVSDPFCCATAWDGLCVQGADQLCNQLDCDDTARCQAPDLVLALASDGVQFTRAEGFVMAAPDDATVDGVCWWGTYYSSQNCSPGPDGFTINYYADNGGLPGPQLASYSQGGGTLTVAPPLATGNVITAGAATEYQHTATHADLVLSPGVCYWIEIFNTGPVSPCRWFWESSAEGDDLRVQAVNGGAWDTGFGDLAFCLNVPLSGVPLCPPTGRCCVDGGCQELTLGQCLAMNGNYGGDGTDCILGACCLGAGDCVITQGLICIISGGVFHGACTSCNDVECVCVSEPGACCLPNGSCVDGSNPAACAFGGGVYLGDCTTCADCP